MRTVIPFLTLVLFIACSSEDKIKDTHHDEESMVSFTQFSPTIKDTFFINVQLPESYSDNPDQRYPIVFLLDGNFLLSNDGLNRALLGHSFGGYFVLFSLLNQLNNKTSYIKTFISASPTLSNNNFYLNQLPQQLEKNNEALGIFMSVGQMEDSAWSVKPLKDLTAEIRKRNLEGLELKSRIYNYLDHMDVAVLSFIKGLQELALDKKK